MFLPTEYQRDVKNNERLKLYYQNSFAQKYFIYFCVVERSYY
jgi:hypothetical protein